ncbi:MAG TPA: hypothetical protein VJN88_13020 [Ktedonobacterales bacterium]|nr:hypothetical protein [Ktedonobacterales bacterium]
MRQSARPTLAAISASAVLILGVFLAGCGQSSNAAGAAATPTCPSRAPTKMVTGAIASVGSGSLTVTQADGTTSTVHLDSKTRITKFSIVASSAITTGARVSVVADTAVTTAKDVLVTPAGATIGGGGGFGRGRGNGTGSGTPTTRVNRSCFPTRTPGTPGVGRPGGPGGIGNFAQGLLGNTTGYQGLTGTVDSVTATKLTFDDAQGQTFSVALTPATMILNVGPGKTTDLAQGEKALASGTPTSDGIAARNLIVIPASVSA